MDFAPAEQVAEAMAAQDRAYELFVEAKVNMREADRLIKQLTDECGNKFICGGEPYVVSSQGSTGKWPYYRPRLDDHKDMPIIDRRDTVPVMPGMSGESVMPPGLAGKTRSLMEKLKEMNEVDGPKPLTFNEPVIDHTGETEPTDDECQTQRTPPPSQPGGGACY
jgi:hypothetical protein